jgi:peptide chain release factor 2
LADATAALELLEFQADDELEQELQTNLAQLNCSLEEFELEQSLSGPGDKNGAYLIIEAGTNNIDAQYWAEMLLRMYTIWGLSRGYQVADLESSPAREIGINSATLEIDGRYACGYLKSETGIHRLKRKSPFNNITGNNIPGGRRISRATVEVLPMYVQLEIPQQDLAMMLPPTCMNYNKLETWVRSFHIPTGISAICGGCRTQMENKDKALAVLKSKLFAIMQRQGVLQLADIQVDRLQTFFQVDRLQTFFNQPIREYQFASDSANQDKVLDLRTGIETTAVAEVLDGKIDSFLKAGLLLKN